MILVDDLKSVQSSTVGLGRRAVLRARLSFISSLLRTYSKDLMLDSGETKWPTV